MITYFSTFISGFQKFIESQLKKDIPDLEINKILDGLVIYETNSQIEEIKRLKYFNNSFVLFYKKENIDKVEEFIKSVLSEFDFNLISHFFTKQFKFRVSISRENELIKLENKLLKKIEESIIQHNKNFVLDRTNPDLEFWFLIRSEKIGLFGARITKHRDYKKVLDKGELRPELAHILLLLSEPVETDIFIDPFSGSASISAARSNYSYNKILSYDLDPKNNRNKMEVKKADATHLMDLDDNSVDKIVTDPPWGIFDKNIDLKNLYSKMLSEFIRILKTDGILVVLVANKELFINILNDFGKQLKILEHYDILVSGKKAGVYKIINI